MAMTRPAALPAPYHRPPDPAGPAPQPETIRLVAAQIDALLSRTPSFYALSDPDRARLRADLERIAAYAAELVRDAWAQAARLGQRPLVREERTYRPAAPAQSVPARSGAAQEVATLSATAPAGVHPSGEVGSRAALPHPVVAAPRGRAPARAQNAQANLNPTAARSVGEITQSTLRAIAFPTFVADLINGTFDAIIGATIKQMQAFQELVGNVSKTVREFERDNVTDNQARDWLVQSYPELLRTDTSSGTPEVVPTEAGESADRATMQGLGAALGLSSPPSSLDETVIEEVLVPAARRKLAESRLQMLSSMVMLGLQRIVVRQGRIRATMGFHIDASDRAHAEQASTFDFAHQNSVQGMFYVAFSARTSVAYVSSQKSDSDSAINVQADLTGEVDLTFETDYLPLNRLALPDRIETIRGNTPNPEANRPENVSARMTERRDTGPSAAAEVSQRIAAHAATPAPTIADGLIDAAASAGRQASGVVTGGGAGGGGAGGGGATAGGGGTAGAAAGGAT